MIADFERRHFLNKSIEDSTDDELLDALNKCYVGKRCFPPSDGSIIGSEIRHCYNLYEAELYNRGRIIKMVFDDTEYNHKPEYDCKDGENYAGED
jgi:hypothetical protein